MFKQLKKIIINIRNYYLVFIKWRHYHIGKNFHAGRNVIIWAKDKIIIGDNCYIGRNSQIECNTIIGNDVLLANNVAFIGRYDHNYQERGSTVRFASQIRDVEYNWLEKNNYTTVEDDVWLGYGVIVLSGVKIKKGAIIAAGSIVTRDVDEYSIYAGSPAKKISNRFLSKEDLEQHQKILRTRDKK
jgi:acetyltransferase-like isoleucine patch superfamily enzyme